jgi:hypothetical protein
MSLKIRRGPNSDRVTITPEEGELIFTTDTKKLYVGDGSTTGGISVGGSTTHSGLTLDDGTNPHGTTKSDVGLSNVDNTSDLSKPISTATQTALDDKVPYTGSTSDVDLGGNSLNAKSLHVKGTGGAGHLGLKHQSGSITASTSESTLGANSSGNPVWKNDGNPIQNVMLENAAITGATKTKITYDSKGLVTSGSDATTADINDSLNRRYVTDSQLTVIGNTSGTNTGDETTSSVKTKLGTAGASSDGYLLQTDWNTFNNKENAISSGTTLQYWRGDKTWQTLDKTAVGLSNVDNTSDLNKPISTATQTALDGKVDENAAITGATKTKITYDSKGLVTSGADATTADIADSTNKRYVTDAQLTVIGNTSGTNTGDQTSINGISGTKTQFNTACSDGDFLYVGDVTQYTDELAQDAVGNILVDSTTVDFTYNDGIPSITADVKDNSLGLAKLTATGTPSATTFLRGDNTWATPADASAAGSNDQIQYNNAGSFAGATNAKIVDNELAVEVVSSPTSPSTGVKIYGVNLGQVFAAFKNGLGIESIIQPALFRRTLFMVKPAGNSTTVTVVGGPALTATGTATAANVATTNVHTRTAGIEYLVTVAATNAIAGFRASIQQYFRGATTSEGGFFFHCIWGPATGVSTATNRAAVGLNANQSAPTDVEPSTLINHLSMAWDAADSNIQFMHNAGSGTSTKIDLGASFPVPTADRTKLYEMFIFCAPGGTTVYYGVRDIGTGAVASGSITTNLPSTTTLMHAKGQISAGGTSSVIGIALKSIHIDSIY